jgi:ABC-type microcin C transport system permease subunit YejB
MLRYALGRLLGIVPTLLIIITAAFFVMRLAPGAVRSTRSRRSRRRSRRT